MRGKSFLLFSATAVSVVAVFIFSTASAYAYAVSSTGQPLGGQPPAQPSSTSTGVNNGYNFGNSFQNLISPFQSFFSGLQWNTSATTQIYPNIPSIPTNTAMPVVNITPNVQNIFTSPLTELDNWFYGLTGVRLSGIVVAILNIISWALGLILGVVNWLLGLFH